MIGPYRGKAPRIHPSVFIAPGAQVIGDVTLGAGSSVWFNAVLRADLAPIRVGKSTNIQDGCVLHVDRDEPCVLKDGVIMGHQATAHACTVEEGALIGIGARVLSGARVGAYSLVGAGALVREGQRIPARSLVVGMPARVVRRLTDKEVRSLADWSERYRRLAADHKKFLG